MARFNARGIEGLELSMEEFAAIPDEIVEEMLEAGSQIVVAAQKRKIEQLGLVDTHTLADSIRAFHKMGDRDNGWKRYVLVYPYGKHGERNRKLVVKAYKRSKHGRTYTVGGDRVDVTNNEVGFVHEYGAPKRGIKAKMWMRQANEEAADDMVAAEARVYDRWLQKTFEEETHE